jgi:hypothetical protein
MQLLHLKPQLISLLLLKLVLKVTAALVVLAMAIVSNKVLVVLRLSTNKDLAWILKCLAFSFSVNNLFLKNTMPIRTASFPTMKSKRSMKISRRKQKLSALKS